MIVDQEKLENLIAISILGAWVFGFLFGFFFFALFGR